MRIIRIRTGAEHTNEKIIVVLLLAQWSSTALVQLGMLLKG